MNIVDQTLRNDVYYILMLQPHSPDNRGLARECKDVKIDRVYIGSCTGGKTEDFLAAAQLMATSVSFLHSENTFLVSDDCPGLKSKYCVMDLQPSIISICDYIQGSESSEVHTPSRNQRESSSLKSSELQLVTLGLMSVLCWVGCLLTGPNSEGANFPGPSNSKGTIFLI
jgi:hypothetical protein